MSKKIIYSFLISFSLISGIFQPKAEASVVIGGAVIGGSWASHPMQGLVATVIATPIAFAGVIVGASLMLLNPAVGVAVMILSDEASLPQHDLELVLSKKYPFIYDRAVIADLATLIKDKFQKALPSDGPVEVSISENEIKSIVETTDLLEIHPKEMRLLIQDLK